MECRGRGFVRPAHMSAPHTAHARIEVASSAVVSGKLVSAGGGLFFCGGADPSTPKKRPAHGDSGRMSGGKRYRKPACLGS